MVATWNIAGTYIAMYVASMHAANIFKACTITKLCHAVMHCEETGLHKAT